MMKLRIYILFVVVALIAGKPSVSFAGDKDSTCFYLDKDKFAGELLPVRLTGNSKPLIELQKRGLFHGGDRSCRWSLNGGSGVREAFALDGGFAVPILNQECESPFSHIYTGIGFGDWYLTLCGRCSNGNNLIVSFQGSEYAIQITSLKQWTEYSPEEFPIVGDKGH